MKISRVRIKKVPPKNGLVGFASVVIDDWLYLGNIAIFTRLDKESDLRLVFPQKQLKNGSISIFYPLASEKYFALEQAVQKKFNELS